MPSTLLRNCSVSLPRARARQRYPGGPPPTYQPFFDYEDRLKSLLIQLAQKGHKEDALRYAEQLRDVEGMQELFNQLTRAPQV